MVTDGGWGPDFEYSTPNTQVEFQMTLRPGVTDPHHQPVCLMNMHVGGRSQFGPLHKLDLSFTPPVASEAGVISPRASSQTLPTDPGTYLLHVVKAVTDSGRADDPATVANLLQVSLTPVNYENHGVISCPATPAMQGNVSLDYLITGNTWFHALPTGKRVLVKGFSTIFAVKLVNLPSAIPHFPTTLADKSLAQDHHQTVSSPTSPSIIFRPMPASVRHRSNPSFPAPTTRAACPGGQSLTCDIRMPMRTWISR